MKPGDKDDVVRVFDLNPIETSVYLKDDFREKLWNKALEKLFKMEFTGLKKEGFDDDTVRGNEMYDALYRREQKLQNHEYVVMYPPPPTIKKVLGRDLRDGELNKIHKECGVLAYYLKKKHAAHSMAAYGKYRSLIIRKNTRYSEEWRWVTNILYWKAGRRNIVKTASTRLFVVFELAKLIGVPPEEVEKNVVFWNHVEAIVGNKTWLPKMQIRMDQNLAWILGHFCGRICFSRLSRSWFGKPYYRFTYDSQNKYMALLFRRFILAQFGYVKLKERPKKYIVGECSKCGVRYISRDFGKKCQRKIGDGKKKCNGVIKKKIGHTVCIAMPGILGKLIALYIGRWETGNLAPNYLRQGAAIEAFRKTVTKSYEEGVPRKGVTKVPKAILKSNDKEVKRAFLQAILDDNFGGILPVNSPVVFCDNQEYGTQVRNLLDSFGIETTSRPLQKGIIIRIRHHSLDKFATEIGLRDPEDRKEFKEKTGITKIRFLDKVLPWDKYPSEKLLEADFVE